MQKTTKGIRKWLSVRMAPVRRPTDEDLFVGEPLWSVVDRIFLVGSSRFNLRNHKDALRRVSRATGKGRAPSRPIPRKRDRLRGAHSRSELYFNEAMSITKRYFTSCLSMRSNASLIF
jgi:hypothetical protein